MLLSGLEEIKHNVCKTTVAQDVRVSALELQAETLEKYGATFVVEDGKLFIEQEVIQ
jgi:hypothetical protein